jgi:hypothetical protein
MAYYATALITVAKVFMAVKSFIGLAPGAYSTNILDL